MKNFIEIPRKEDYHETTYIDLQQARIEPQREKDLILYHKGRINMRSIVDVHEWTLKLDVIDEDKFAEWDKARSEWMERNKARMISPIPIGSTGGMAVDADQQAPPPFSIFDVPPPPVPIKSKTIKVTAILYFSGVQRFIMDDYREFCEIYDHFLQKQKLDM